MANKNPIFRTAYNYEREEHKGKTPTGLPEVETWEYKINEYGQKKLVVTGKTNVYEKIQAALEETKIETVLKRATAGDTSMLHPDGVYMDVTQLPNNLIEARQAMQNLENVWGNLPNEIKEKYHFDVEEFIGASGSDSWLRDMGLIGETKQDKIVEETKVETGEVKQDE